MDSHFIVFAIISGVVSLFSVILNALVCLLFYKSPQLLDSSNIIILSIAIGDLLYSLVSMVTLTVSNTLGEWAFGDSGCKFYAFITTLSGLGSLFHLTAGACERYFSIVRAFRHKLAFTQRKAVLTSLAMWLCALFWSTMPLIGWSNYEPEGIGTSCSVNWRSQAPLNVSFILCLIIICFIIPVFIIILFHCKACLAIRKGSARAKLSWGKSSINTRKVVAVERKMALLFLIMTTVFLVAWTPYAVVSLMSLIRPELIKDLIASVPAYVAKFSACYNPFIYVLIYKRFRRELFRLLGCQLSEPLPSVVAV